MGTIVLISKVEGRLAGFVFYCYQVYVTTLTYMYHDNVVIHTPMRITGRFNGYFLSVHMANLSATGLKLLALLQFAPKTFETNELEHEVPATVKLPPLITRRDSGCLALCTL